MSELTAVVIDDSISALTQMLNLLRSIGTCSPVGFIDPVEGLDYCRAHEVGLVVVDYEMPGMNGVQFIESFREDRDKALVPVVMVTSTEDKEVRYLALQVGATDFLSKPLDPVEFIARLNNQIAASQAYKTLASLSRWLTDYDAVTRLPNREQALKRLAHAIDHARQESGEVAVLLISIDRFKQVIETHGHAGGDELLRQVAQRLETDSRGDSILARIGDGDFALILPAVRGASDLQGMIEAIRGELAEPFPIHDSEIFTSVSIGVSLYPTDGLTASDLLRSAHTALNTAQQQETGGWRFFTAELDDEVRKRMQVESKLRHALANGELSLNYHPQVDMATGEMMAAEALLRWRNADLGPVGPDLFIPIAEETGLIVPIGAWVVEQVCRDMADWNARGLPPLRIAVNVSSRQLADDSLFGIIESALAANGLGPERLEIEVTERLLLDRSPRTLSLLNDLRAMGLRFSIDDFGTGYSSMSYLTSFPFDVLKVDRSFVSKVTERKQDAALTQAIIAMARSLDLEVVAEGVETAEQLDFLRRCGCTFAQGYLFAKPMPASALAERLAGPQKVTS